MLKKKRTITWMGRTYDRPKRSKDFEGWSIDLIAYLFEEAVVWPEDRSLVRHFLRLEAAFDLNLPDVYFSHPAKALASMKQAHYKLWWRIWRNNLQKQTSWEKRRIINKEVVEAATKIVEDAQDIANSEDDQ